MFECTPYFIQYGWHFYLCFCARQFSFYKSYGMSPFRCSQVNLRTVCVPVGVNISRVLQRWQKSGTHLEHLASRFCVDSEMALDGIESSKMLVISPCELSAHTQRWEMPFSWSFLPDLVSPLGAQLESKTHIKTDRERERAQHVPPGGATSEFCCVHTLCLFSISQVCWDCKKWPILFIWAIWSF